MVRDLCSKRTAADKIMNKMNENRKIVLDTLNEQNIEYEMFEHQAVYTVDEIEDSDLWNHENGIGAKNLFLRDGSGKHHFLVIIREDKQADLKKVRYAHEGYSTDIGIDYESALQADSREEAESILQREIEEALMADPSERTLYVGNITFQWEADHCLVTVQVQGIDGDTEITTSFKSEVG